MRSSFEDRNDVMRTMFRACLEFEGTQPAAMFSACWAAQRDKATALQNEGFAFTAIRTLVLLEDFGEHPFRTDSFMPHSVLLKKTFTVVTFLTRRLE